MAFLLVIGLVGYFALERFIDKNGDIFFKDVGKYKDEYGNLHDTDYYYDYKTGEYKKAERK